MWETTRFIKDGDITTRGEIVSSYKKGDKVHLLDEVTSNLVRVTILEGESIGLVAVVDKEYLE